MTTYITRTTKLTIVPSGEPLYSDRATSIEIDDEAGGEFIRVNQSGDSVRQGTIAFDPEEWSSIRAAIDLMVESCQKI